jgi:hypothetical protein
MSVLLAMQTRGAGIGGPVAKPRFMSFARALNSLKPLNSATPASVCSPIKRVRGSSHRVHQRANVQSIGRELRQLTSKLFDCAAKQAEIGGRSADLWVPLQPLLNQAGFTGSGRSRNGEFDRRSARLPAILQGGKLVFSSYKRRGVSCVGVIQRGWPFMAYHPVAVGFLAIK